jgi:hypothetical protein
LAQALRFSLLVLWAVLALQPAVEYLRSSMAAAATVPPANGNSSAMGDMRPRARVRPPWDLVGSVWSAVGDLPAVDGTSRLPIRVILNQIVTGQNYGEESSRPS